MRLHPSVVLLALALAACSDKPPVPKADPPAAADPPRVATPWDDLKKTEQRARDVQQTVDRQAARQRDQIEQAGQ